MSAFGPIYVMVKNIDFIGFHIMWFYGGFNTRC